ncbi:MAG: S9 family peptidase [Acidobacteriales bacterium]|nr:S9 family peptidase [Terriglobales bacterium]
MKKFVVVLAALLAAVAASARTPLTHESMWLMKRVGAPSPSPDGQWVVFSVVEPSYDEKEQTSDLWLVRADGIGAPRRITFSKAGESGVAWSPDSRRIAFSTKRENDEVSQIYILDLAAGGEAMRVTSLSAGASQPRFSPDGRRLLFQSTVYPGAVDDAANRKIADERKARKYNARVYDGFPIRNWDRWLDDRQVHLFVQAVEPGATARDLLAGTKLCAGAGFGGVSGMSGDDLQPVWAPDGKAVVFVATENRNQAAYATVVTHLYSVSTTGGEPVALTRGDTTYAKPVFSPDGKALYALANREAGVSGSLDRLVRFAWPSPDDPAFVTPGWERSVGAFALSPDSGTIFMTAEEAGLVKLFSVRASGGEVKNAFEQASGAYSGLSIPPRASELVLIVNWESAVSPAEVYRVDLAANRQGRLTDFNTARSMEIDWQPTRHFWFKSKAGKPIHSLLVLPPNFDPAKKYPLLTLIHGGPHSMSTDHFFLRWNPHLLASPGYVVIQTNYTGSTGFGEQFARDIRFDPFKTPGDEINQAVEEAARRFAFVDGTRVAAAGASYGGHMVNWLQATTTSYKCLVGHAGLINLESQWGTSDTIYHREADAGGPPWEQGKVWLEQNPIRFARNFRTPVLLTIGENDFRVPLNQTLENWSVLQRMKVPSRLIVFPGANHWIQKGEDSRYFYREVLAWLAKYL